jgi:putative oxidoreductase
MDWVLLLGRIGFAYLFVSSGLTVHLLQRKTGIEYARMNGVPAPEFLVPFSGLMAIAGGLSIALGVWADLGALILVAFLVPVAFGMHAFWKQQDPMQRLFERVQFTKDLTLAAASLAFFALFQQFGDQIGLMLTGALFG